MSLSQSEAVETATQHPEEARGGLGRDAFRRLRRSPTAIVGAQAHRKRGYLDVGLVIPLAVGGLVGGFAASLVALELDPVLLQRGLAVLLILAIVQLARRRPPE